MRFFLFDECPRKFPFTGIFVVFIFLKGLPMPTLMPTDDNNNPIPALRLKDGGSHSIAATATSARNTNAFGSDTQVISICPTVPVFVKCGVSTVTAATTDHYIPAGLYYDIAIGGDGQKQTTYIAVLRAESADGIVYISEKN